MHDPSEIPTRLIALAKRSVWGSMNDRQKMPFRFIRTLKPITRLLGPEFQANHSKIEIDITYRCNLSCYQCNKSCGLAPRIDDMDLDQIRAFIRESVSQKRKWELITLLGGESTLHPQLLDILHELIAYKNSHSPKTTILLVTNGVGKRVNAVLSRLPSEIEIKNSNKAKLPVRHYTFNVAPIDLLLYRFADYSNACSMPLFCGIGLNRYGYYICSVASAIDSVFGFDIGRKSLPAEGETLHDQAQQICKVCGRFKGFRSNVEPRYPDEMSKVWINAYKRFKKKRPLLTSYA